MFPLYFVASSSRHRCVRFYKIGQTWTYCTIQSKSKWRGNFRSLMKYQNILGLITPRSYYSRSLFSLGSQVFASLETQGQSVGSGEKALSSTFVAPFLPTGLTATGSLRMRSLIGKHIVFHNSYMYLSNTLFLPPEIYMYMYSCEFKTRLKFVVWLLTDYYCYKSCRILVVMETIETLRSRLFGISRELQTPRSHVTSALLSGLQFDVHVCMARPCSKGKWLTARCFLLYM